MFFVCFMLTFNYFIPIYNYIYVNICKIEATFAQKLPLQGHREYFSQIWPLLWRIQPTLQKNID